MSDPTHKLFLLTPISEEASGDAKDDPGIGWCLSCCQGHPPPNRGALMHLNGFENLPQLVSSGSLISFREIVNDIVGWPESSDQEMSDSAIEIEGRGESPDAPNRR